MEIIPGLHRLESYIGDKLIAHHLITGDQSVLIDAGTPVLARDELIPWLAGLLGSPAALNLILVTHADVDHFGGLATLRQACPRVAILAPARDSRWIESTDAIFAERYDAYHADFGLTYEPAVVAMLHDWHGPSVPVDVGLSSGAYLRGGAGDIYQVLHVPGHTPGHLMLWNARHRVAIIGDALNGATQIDRHGAWTAPPPYIDRDLYLASIQLVRALQPDVLLTGHYPVMRGQEATTFIEASHDFVVRLDHVLADIMAETRGPVTLHQLIDRVNALLGPFGFPPDLAFAIVAHMDWMEHFRTVRRIRHHGVVAWTGLR